MAVSLFLASSLQASTTSTTPPAPLTVPLKTCSKTSTQLFLDPSSFVTVVDTINKNAAIIANFINCTGKDYQITQAALRMPPASILTNANVNSKVALTITDTLLPDQTAKAINLSAPSVSFLLNQCDLVEIDFLFTNSDNTQIDQSFVFVIKTNNTDICAVKDPDSTASSNS